jgi:tetratricopeptide (TPR) repeat protein
MGRRALAALRHPAWLGIVGLLPYLQTLTHGLVDFDDPWLIRDNALLRYPSWRGLGQIWFDLSPELRLRLGAEYLPLRDMSVMLDYALYDSWFGGFHLTNLVLYGLLCAAAGTLVLRWTGRLELAWTAGLLWALHPLHAESVAWLSERKGLLAALGVLAAGLLFHRFVRRPSWGRGLAVAACAVLAVWSKAVGVTAVPLLGLLLWLLPPGDRAPGSGRAAWLGWAGISAAALLAALPVYLVGSQLVAEQQLHGGGLLSSAWLAARVQGLYLEQFLLGAQLGIGYELPAGTRGLVLGAAGALLATVMAGLALTGLWRRGAWAVAGLAGAAWWVFSLPTSQLLIPLQNVVADRYTLLPSLALALALALLLGRLGSRWLRLGLVGLMAAMAAVMTVEQAASWASPRALYAQALRADPRSLSAMIQLSSLEADDGRLDRAWAWLERARATHPHSSRVLLHQGLLHNRQGRRQQAIAAFRRAAEMDPLADKARANLALLLRADRPRQALAWARQAARIRHQSPHNQRTLGVVALDNGLLSEARLAFSRALRLQPHSAQNLYNLAVVSQRQGQHRQARNYLRRALKLDPGFRPAVEMNRGHFPPQ